MCKRYGPVPVGLKRFSSTPCAFRAPPIQEAFHVRPWRVWFSITSCQNTALFGSTSNSPAVPFFLANRSRATAWYSLGQLTLRNSRFWELTLRACKAKKNAKTCVLRNYDLKACIFHSPFHHRKIFIVDCSVRTCPKHAGRTAKICKWLQTIILQWKARFNLFEIQLMRR